MNCIDQMNQLEQMIQVNQMIQLDQMIQKTQNASQGAPAHKKCVEYMYINSILCHGHGDFPPTLRSQPHAAVVFAGMTG